ncbi:response regulator [Fundidesulfovibrio terrae]|uniref:response regulator n=1 Tax=Fundidesulfovibrio terrae TaxID=2922866 RepID=UPI001FAF9430|nr:response regulator [Fundidesulfovibrio terrae]
MRVLIIDDDPINLLFLSEILGPFAEVDSVSSGQDGVDSFERALAEGNRYDAVLVDIRMPGMDGHQTLQKIRGIERDAGLRTESETAAIMVSAMNDAQNVNRAFFQGGAISFLSKPVDPDLLLGELRKFGLLG